MSDTEVGNISGAARPDPPPATAQPSVLTRAAGVAIAQAATALFAAHSLKSHPDEGGLTESQAGLVRGWKRQLTTIAAERLATFARAAALRATLAASGSPPDPVRTETEPFSSQLLDRLATDPDPDPDPAEVVAAGVRELAVDLPPVGALAPWLPDPDPAAAVGDPAGWRELASAYRAALDAAGPDGGGFAPVRPVVSNPTVTGREPDRVVVADERTRAVADVFNAAWETTLLLLARSVQAGPVAPDPVDGRAACELLSSVVRPLGEALARLPVGGAQPPGVCAGPTFADLSPTDLPATGGPAASASRDERLWRMALDTSRLALQPDLPPELYEAAAALQRLATRSGPAGVPDSTARLAELRTIQAHAPAGIRTVPDGPYLATNVEDLRTPLGEPIATLPLVALCRCGKSESKPFCDGSHARVDFTDRKDPRRVGDRRDTYHGLPATIFDNRGLCAHSGYCTDRLPSVFHLDEEPFVAPSGGRQDEILRAVRSCPSGALSYAIDGQEARDQVDQKRPPAIEVTQDGPYRVTGGIPLTDASGAPEPRPAGASQEHYSLCRCGQSQNKPFCSGMHWHADFHDPPPPEEPTLFQWAGGLPALLRMTQIFYSRYVPEDPLLAPLFARMSPDHPERVAAWLGEVFGGPSYYSERYGGYPRMVTEHIGKAITEEHRARWVSLLHRAADDARLPADPEFRAAFVGYLEWGSRIAQENSSEGARPPDAMPIPKWWWVCEATPYARPNALELGEPEPPVPLPAPGEPVSFERHIRPRFRTRDRRAMRFAFDLWDYDEVREHAAGILARLRDGSMPCDGAWPPEQVDLFQSWLDAGTPA